MDFFLWSPVARGVAIECVERRDQGKLFCGGRQLAKTWAKTESAVSPCTLQFLPCHKPWKNISRASTGPICQRSQK